MNKKDVRSSLFLNYKSIYLYRILVDLKNFRVMVYYKKNESLKCKGCFYSVVHILEITKELKSLGEILKMGLE